MFTVLDVRFFDSSMHVLMKHIRSMVQHKEHAYVCITSLHGLFEAQQRKEFKNILNTADFTVCDGMPLVWLGKVMKRPNIARIYGPDLMLNVCTMAERDNIAIFLFGTTPQTLTDLSSQLRKIFPKLVIAGVYAPSFAPLTEKENKKIYRQINASGAQIVFVGLSTPKQEQWMYAAKQHIATKVFIGVGAAFDFISGSKKQAPTWMRNYGLEWIFRCIQEPERLGKRYVMILFYAAKVVGKRVMQKIRALLCM